MEGLRIMAVPPLWQEDSKKQIWGQEVDHKDEGRIKGRCTLVYRLLGAIRCHIKEK